MIYGMAGLWVPFPRVPGAYDFAVFDRALAERATLMEALVVHGGDFAPHVGDADHFAVAREVAGFVGVGEMGLGNQFDEGHRFGSNTCRAFAQRTAEDGCPHIISAAAFAR